MRTPDGGMNEASEEAGRLADLWRSGNRVAVLDSIRKARCSPTFMAMVIACMCDYIGPESTGDFLKVLSSY